MRQYRGHRFRDAGGVGRGVSGRGRAELAPGAYVKRLSFNNQDPMWHHGFQIEGEAPKDEPHRGIILYHQKSKPHERADLIIELPDIGHKIWNFTFDRGHCFDPPGAEIVPYHLP